MKIIKLTAILLSTGIVSLAQANDALQPKEIKGSGKTAVRLIEGFDTDGSAALNQLELSNAINHLREGRSIPTRAQRAERPSPPKVAVDLVDGFDKDADVQLTQEELAEALADLRQKARQRRTQIAVADRG